MRFVCADWIMLGSDATYQAIITWSDPVVRPRHDGWPLTIARSLSAAILPRDFLNKTKNSYPEYNITNLFAASNSWRLMKLIGLNHQKNSKGIKYLI